MARRFTSLTRYFEWLGAPLKNFRWSWGALRPRDGAVFLRVFEDEVRSEGGKRLVQVLGQWGTDRHGYNERLEHLDRIRAGAECYLIFCTAVDTSEEPRQIESFDEDTLYRAGALVDRGETQWIEVRNRVTADEVKRTG